MQECCSNTLNDSRLSNAAEKEITALIGNELAYIIAVDKNGKTTPIITASNNFESRNEADISIDNPIKTQAITHLETITFLSYQGSCWNCFLWGGRWICVPC